MRILGIAAATALALSACAAPPTMPSAGGRLRVVAGFYPLAHLVDKVGGDRVSVSTLTQPGADPHDLELAPRQIASLADANLVVHLGAFQPAVDDAIASTPGVPSYDVAAAAHLLTPEEESDENTGEHTDENTGEHADENTGDHPDDHTDDGHAHGATDPHFWLDPTRYADVAEAIADELTHVDPAGASTYAANAATFATQLRAFDAEATRALASCTNRHLVTSHAAFGYLATRYSFTQVPITLNPDAEANPAAMAEVVDEIRSQQVHTIYTETLASPALAETLATETGASTAVLDPIEGITDASAAPDYLGVMRANLTTLTRGQGC